jgi:hypothetical protein
MTLTAAIATDPSGSRRFRRIAPLAVLIGLSTMILGPGLAQVVCRSEHVAVTEIRNIDPLVQQIVTSPGRASGSWVEAVLSAQ